MEIENRHYKRYVTIYMIEGAVFLAAILVLVFFFSNRGDALMSPLLAKSLTAIKVSVYVLSGLCLGVIFLLRFLTMRAVALKGTPESKAEFLAKRGTLINVFSYLPAICAIVLYLLGLHFKDVKYYLFATIVLSYVAFYRYNRFAELTGIARLNG